MHLTTSLTEETLTETQFHEDGITVHYWRVFREECLDHFEVLLTLWVGDHRIVAQLRLRVDTPLVLAVDGRAITLEAFHDGIGIASLAKMATTSAPFDWSITMPMAWPEEATVGSVVRTLPRVLGTFGLRLGSPQAKA